MKPFGYLTLLTLILLFSLSCATIQGTQHREEQVTVNSNVEGVTLTCDAIKAVTPAVLTLPVRSSRTCTAELAGYESQTFRIDSRITKEGFKKATSLNKGFGKWTLGIGFLLSWPVDALSGAMKDFPEKEIVLEMKPLGSTGRLETTANKVMKAADSLVRAPLEAIDQTSDALLNAAVHDTSSAVKKTGGMEIPEEVSKE